MQMLWANWFPRGLVKQPAPGPSYPLDLNAAEPTHGSLDYNMRPISWPPVTAPIVGFMPFLDGFIAAIGKLPSGPAVNRNFPAGYTPAILQTLPKQGS